LNTLKTIIKLRRDTEYNFKRIGDTLIPLKGEVLIVDTPSHLRAKVGDGVKTFNELPYDDDYIIGQVQDIVVRGYYYNNAFYKDRQHKEKCVPYEYKVYIDYTDNCMYCWKDEIKSYCTLVAMPDATPEVKGVMKLYDEHGEHTDGTMTQKSVTKAMDNIKLKLDEVEEECLILGTPW